MYSLVVHNLCGFEKKNWKNYLNNKKKLTGH